jgi:chemotaxis protein CheD
MVVEALQLAETIEVSTGEVRTASNGVLRASALGSCVAVAMLDTEVGVGGLAHVMLPRASPHGSGFERTKYAEDGIRELILDMTTRGAQPACFVAFLVGGGNILERDDDTICAAKVRSMIEMHEQKAIPIEASEIGGTARRSIALDVESVRITYTVGDSASMLLWQDRDRNPVEGGDA